MIVVFDEVRSRVTAGAPGREIGGGLRGHRRVPRRKVGSGRGWSRFPEDDAMCHYNTSVDVER